MNRVMKVAVNWKPQRVHPNWSRSYTTW
jgi:hypothetical protein